jgi:hypothetical protein
VVGLDATDGNQRVAALRQGVGNQVLELPGFVAPEREATIAVLAFCPHVGAAQPLAEPIEAMHGRRPEEQRLASELGEFHEPPGELTAGKSIA